MTVQATDSTGSGYSVIIMIGDGMGPEQVEFGRLVEYGIDGTTVFDTFEYENTVRTDNIDGTTTDSAASATVLSTGVKTKNGRIGMNFDASMELTTILEIAENNNYTTALVSTCQVTHATPAGFAAHEKDRGDYTKIASDMAQSGVDLLLGGGQSTEYFGEQISLMQSNGYAYITNASELEAAESLPLLGLFAAGHPDQEALRNETSPALHTMVEKALCLLNGSESPFFMMIEGSQIDWAGHANNQTYLAHEMIEFEKTVKIVKQFVEAKGDTLLLVTADHECGGLSIINTSQLSETLPQSTDTLATLRTLRSARANEIEVEWSTGGHTPTKVPLVGVGPYAERIETAEHHVDTFSMMRLAIEGIATPVGSGWYEGYMNPN